MADLADALRARRSCREFLGEPVPDELLDPVLAAAARAPSAGNTWSLDLVVLTGEDTARYWDLTLGALGSVPRASFRWPGLLAAPVLVVPYCEPAAYVRRYSEPDKAAKGLGVSEEAWEVPYWWVDGGAAVMAMLLSATGAGLGSCLFGQFSHEAAIRAAFGVPEGRRALGTIALGWPSPDASPSGSALRGRPPISDFVHRGRW